MLFGRGSKTVWTLFLATIVVFLMFDAVASTLGSDRGQQGVVVAGVVLIGLLLAQRLIFRESPRVAMRSLGLFHPAPAGVVAAVLVSLVLAGSLFAIACTTSVGVSLYPRWFWLIPGLFAQAGIAEEALFRGFLFGRLRRDRTFLHAASLSLVPFVLAHLVLFARMPWPIALAAVLLSLVMSFPLARLFELGGSTIWAPAIVHFVAQGALKVTEWSGESAPTIPLFWMAACAVVPYGVFLVRR